LFKLLDYKFLFILKRRPTCTGSCKRQAGQTCKSVSGTAYNGAYCAPNYACQEYGYTPDEPNY
jgi:hypothetical protein